MHPFLAMIVPMGAAPGSPDNSLPGGPTYPSGGPVPPSLGTPPGIWPGGTPEHPIVLPPAGPPPHVPSGKVLIMVYKGTIGWRWAVVDPADLPGIDNSLPGGGGRPDNSLPGSQPGVDNSLPGGGGRPDNTLPPSAAPKK